MTFNSLSIIYLILSQYRIRRCPIPPLCLVPCKFGKILVVGKMIEQNFILKIFVLEITSRKIFFSFFSLGTSAIIKQSSIHFFGKISSSVCFCKLSMKLAKAISSLSISFTPDHLKSIAFSSFQDQLFVQQT